MANISNKFIVTAMLDGQTVSGELVATRSLWQAIDNVGNIIPNWSTASESNKPTLYPLLQSGGSILAPKTITWRYNNEVIEFDASTNLSINSAFPGVFKSSTYTISGSVVVPCLMIMENLAQKDVNEDNDTISMSGSVTVKDTDLTFEAIQMVHITRASSTANICELILVGGKNTLTSDTDTVQIQAIYHTTETTSGQQYTTEWFWNDDTTPKRTTTGTSGHIITIQGSDVEDYVVVKAVVSVLGEQKAIAFIGIDDIGDINQMQFAYTIYQSDDTPPTSIIQNNTTAATLKSGQSVRYAVWIGTTEDPFNQLRTDWTYSAKIYASDGTDITNTETVTKKIAQPVITPNLVVGTTTIAEDACVMDVSFSQAVENGGQVSVIMQASYTE